MDFQKWEILRELSGKFLDTIEMAFVVGTKADTAFLITNDDQVFGIGQNINGCLGVGQNTRCPFGLPTKISSLSKKGVEGIVCGGDGDTNMFMVAYLYSGEIYWWGKTPVRYAFIHTPHQIGDDFKIQVKAVACGRNHCAILSKDGEVFTWGQNECGQLGRTTNKSRSSIPDRVKGKIEGQTVTDISCGLEFSVVLLADGRVLTWGDNNFGQLGLNFCDDAIFSPTEVSTLRDYYDCDCVIEKIACGQAHVLALSKTGVLYAWGDNYYGQLGKEFIRSDKIGCPMEVKVNNLRVVDIGASYLHNLSVAQCANGKVYMWGEIMQNAEMRNNIFEPSETGCESIGEIFESVVIPKAMFQPMRRLKSTTKEHNQIETLPETVEKEYNNPSTTKKYIEVETLPETVEKEYNNPDTSDLKIIVDDKEICVHQSILKMRSEYFNTLISRWLEEDERVPSITIKEKSFAAIEAYVKYLYTDKLDIDLTLAVELLQLADEYRDNNFKSVCEKAVLRNLTVDDVADVFAYTRKLENGKNVNRLCLEFALRHATEVMNSSGFESWDPEMKDAFLNEYVKVKGNCR